MKAIKMNDGDINFSTISGIEEFWQRVVNSLKIYSIECFYDENLGLDIRIINEQDVAEYKLEIISEEERTLKAKIYITHKEHNDIEKEVIISG